MGKTDNRHGRTQLQALLKTEKEKRRADRRVAWENLMGGKRGAIKKMRKLYTVIQFAKACRHYGRSDLIEGF